MGNLLYGEKYRLRILESPDEMAVVEDIQRVVWPGDDIEVVPSHMLLTVAHNGGLIIGAYYIPDKETLAPTLGDDFEGDIPSNAQLIGFVYGFPGLYSTSEGFKVKHCSHQMGVHPDHRNQGIGFALKRAQWQMVRHQGIDLITWTYDPLLSRNAYLNLSKLGAVCSTYIRNLYGDLRDGLNVGLPTDRFQVDWWTASTRVTHRLSNNARSKLDLAHFLAAGAEIVNPTIEDDNGFPWPNPDITEQITMGKPETNDLPAIVLVEIPADFLALKTKNFMLAKEWRFHTRTLFEYYFNSGYYVTDFIYLSGKSPRSFYALSQGDQTL